MRDAGRILHEAARRLIHRRDGRAIATTLEVLGRWESIAAESDNGEAALAFAIGTEALRMLTRGAL